MVAILVILLSIHSPTSLAADTSANEKQGEATIEILKNKDDQVDPVVPTEKDKVVPNTGVDGNTTSTNGYKHIPSTYTGSNSVTAGTMTGKSIPQTNEIRSFAITFVGTSVLMFFILFLLFRRRGGAEDEK